MSVLGEVTQDRADIACRGCGQVVSHFVILGHGLALLTEKLWRPVPHLAGCGRDCAQGDHLRRPMVDLHWSADSCARCSPTGVKERGGA